MNSLNARKIRWGSSRTMLFTAASDRNEVWSRIYFEKPPKFRSFPDKSTTVGLPIVNHTFPRIHASGPRSTAEGLVLWETCRKTFYELEAALGICLARWCDLPIRPKMEVSAPLWWPGHSETKCLWNEENVSMPAVLRHAPLRRIMCGGLLCVLVLF